MLGWVGLRLVRFVLVELDCFMLEWVRFAWVTLC